MFIRLFCTCSCLFSCMQIPMMEWQKHETLHKGCKEILNFSVFLCTKKRQFVDKYRFIKHFLLIHIQHQFYYIMIAAHKQVMLWKCIINHKGCHRNHLRLIQIVLNARPVHSLNANKCHAQVMNRIILCNNLTTVTLFVWRETGEIWLRIRTQGCFVHRTTSASHETNSFYLVRKLISIMWLTFWSHPCDVRTSLIIMPLRIKYVVMFCFMFAFIYEKSHTRLLELVGVFRRWQLQPANSIQL